MDKNKTKKFKLAQAPLSQLEAGYFISSPLASMIWHEVDCIRLCNDFVSKHFDQFKIRIMTSEMLDLIFEECKIDIDQRAKALKEVKDQISGKRAPAQNDKLFELLQIRGNCEQVREKIQEFKGLVNRKKMLEALEYFE